MSMFWIFKLSQTLYDCRYSMNVWEQVITNNQSNKSFIDKKNNPPDTDANGHKLKLQDSNLTAGQPRTAPITLYISFNKHRRLTNEELINLTGIQEANSVLQHHAPDVIHSRSISAFWLSSDSWLLFTPLLHHSISDNELNSLLFLCDLSQPFEKVHPNSSSHQRWMPSVHLSEDPNLFFNNYHWLRLQFLLLGSAEISSSSLKDSLWPLLTAMASVLVKQLRSMVPVSQINQMTDSVLLSKGTLTTRLSLSRRATCTLSLKCMRRTLSVTLLSDFSSRQSIGFFAPSLSHKTQRKPTRLSGSKESK